MSSTNCPVAVVILYHNCIAIIDFRRHFWLADMDNGLQAFSSLGLAFGDFACRLARRLPVSRRVKYDLRCIMRQALIIRTHFQLVLALYK